jgi:type IV pilus assembly protein PilW
MISMALGLIILLGIMQVLLINIQSHRVQDGISRMQESARFALEEISYNVRNAGYMGCLSDISKMFNSLVETGDVNTGAAGGFLTDFKTAIVGNDGLDEGNGWSPAADASVLNGLDHSDMLSVRTVLDASMFTTQAMPTTAAALHVTASNQVFAGDILMITDCVESGIFQATQYNGANTIVHNTGNGAGLPQPNNTTKFLGKRYDAGSQILKMDMITYYIANSSAGDGPALWQQRFADSANAVELAPHVERFHVAFGHDVDSDDIVDVYRNSSDANVNWSQVVTARLFLLMRSPTPLPIDVDNRVFVMAGETMGPYADRYARQLFTKTISIRNRLP